MSESRPRPTVTPTLTPTARADDARRGHAVAQHRFAVVRRRGRRTARHDLEIAEQRLERADAYLERTRQRTEPAIGLYRQAQVQRREAHDNLHYHDTAGQLDAIQHPLDIHRRRVNALETWRHWATGHDVDYDLLRQAVDTLDRERGPHNLFATGLADVLQRWAHDNGVDLRPQLSRNVTIGRVGPELGL